MIIYVPLSQIRDNPFQKRSEYGDIEELANDIYRHKHTRPDTLGLQQIPNGRLAADDDGLLIPTASLDLEDWLDGDKLRPGWSVQLEFGHRRNRAFQHLMQIGRHEYHVMPVIIRDLTDEQMLDGVHSENAKRKDISAVEEAELVAEKIKLTGRTQKEIGAEWGMGRSTITNLLSLLKLPEPVQEANRRGILSARQCSALATIARIGELADDVEWDTHPSPYGAPVSPDDYMQMVIENPDAFTSDAIRAMTKRMLDHAGAELPDVVATFDCAAAPLELQDRMVQLECKGCAWRVNGKHCLNAGCFKAKQQHIINTVLAEASADLGLPVSDQAKHIELSYEHRQALKDYWQSGPTDDPNLVIGWLDFGCALRPYTDDQWAREEKVWGKDGDLKAAVVIGHLNPKYIPVAELVEADIADQATVETWKKQTEKVRKANVTAAKANLRDVLETAVADFRPLVALIQPLDAETTDDGSALADLLLEFLWKRGAIPYASDATSEMDSLNKILRRAGAEPLPALSIQERAALVLSEWYRIRGWVGGYHKPDQQAAADAIEALRRELTVQDADYFQISFELDRAADDARRVLGVGEEETAVSERDRILQDPNADIDEVSAAADELMDEVIAELTEQGLLPREAAQ